MSQPFENSFAGVQDSDEPLGPSAEPGPQDDLQSVASVDQPVGPHRIMAAALDQPVGPHGK
jgi:hypothetical protein